METRLSEFKKNILIWYPFKENASVLNLENGFEEVLGDLDVKFEKIVTFSQNTDKKQVKIVANKNANRNNKDDKFDYVTIIGKYTYNFTEKLEVAKKYVKNDGKILVALDNRFGLKNWNDAQNLNKDISEKELRNILKENKFDNFKFYYILSNYKMANLIYSEDYTLTKEDITRNFAVYPKDTAVHLNENEVYKKILEDGDINKFINSFFIEISNKKIETDVKYVTFSNYRKPEYRTMTIIKNNIVIKKAVEKKAQKHIEKIAQNLEGLKEYKVKSIEEFKDGKIVSPFIKSERFDSFLEKSKSIEEFKNNFEILKNILDSKIIENNEIIEEIKKYQELEDKSEFENKLNLKNSILEYDIEKLKKLHFIENAYIDLVPKNCFFENNIIGKKLEVFDQEWVEQNVPVEYIYYRSILNTTEVLNKFGKEELLKSFEILEYVDLFEELEKDLRDKSFDYEIHDIFFRQYIDSKRAEKQRFIYKKEAFELRERLQKLEEENHSLNLELEDARGKLVDYANQLRVISNSSSWKLIQKLRGIIGFFKFRKGVSLIDKLYPVGTTRREKYDLKQAKKKEINRIKKIKNSVDEETASYWFELEKIYAKNREKIENLVLEEDSDPYQFWIKANEPTIEELKMQEEKANNFLIKPKISILVPLYNTDIKFFRELLFTLYYQTYKNWELCLADGSPKKLEEIEKICSKDSRIKYHYIGENKGISGNTNEALKLATGEYIALLDHDDLLTLNSLYEIVKCINEKHDVEFIYTDEDKIEAIDGIRYDPHFKPDYAPDFLMSGNYICHFSVFKKELMDKLEGFRSEYDGAQDFDIILRATNEANNIYHIPKILYHWRIHPGSTAGNSEAKLYAYIAGEKAVQDHLKRIGSNGIAARDENINGFYRVTYPVVGNPKVNILILNKDNVKYLKNCIDSILSKTTYSNFEIDVIDNCSTDFETLKYYKEIENLEKVKVIRYEEKYLDYDFDFQINNSKLINNAIKKLNGEFIVELDRHEKIKTQNWLEIMIGIAQRKEVGLVGAKVYYSNGTIKHAGIAYNIGDYAAYLYRETYNGYRVKDRMICNCSIISSLCRMYRKEVFEEVLGMNEEYNFEFLNEVDFSFRLRQKGYLNIYTPQVEINDFDIFNERENILEEDTFEYNREIKKLKEEWKKVFSKPDPYHNINFSPASANCVLRIDKVIY